MTASRLKRLNRLAPLLFALAVLLALLYVVLGLPLRNARESWRDGRYADAIQTLESWSRLNLRRADYDNLLAASYLTAGRGQDARPRLARMARRKPELFPVIRKVEVGSRMIAAGRYEEFLRYDTAVRSRGDGDEIALYRAAAQLGAGRVAEADTTLATVDGSDVDPKKYAALRSALDERKRGSFGLVFDRAGKTIAAYEIANADLVAVNRNFAPLVDREAGALTIESHLHRLGTATLVETTLDSQVQEAAVRALGGLRGSLVVIDVPTNELLAIASTAGRGSPRNLALEAEYEPGSIIKVLTALNTFDSKIDLAKKFPLDCAGFLVLNGRQFFDWAKHGQLADINESLAVSCNVAFAQLGLAVGPQRLKTFMINAGFGGEVDLRLFRVPLGRTLGDITIANDYAVANFAVGLEHERVNALHVAMLASMVANRGQLTTPRLVRSRRSILGDPIGEVAPPRSTTVVSEAAARAVLPAMRAVVEHPRGSGRRAEIPGLPIAMKTGTAGESAGGYNAVIMAFAPAEAPRFAIGMIAEDAGPAEFAGAKVARDFFTAVQSRLK